MENKTTLGKLLNIDDPITLVEQGDLDAAITILMFSAEHLERGAPLPATWARWLASGLRGIADGNSSEEAFKIKQPGNRRPKYLKDMRLLIGEMVALSDRKHRTLTENSEKPGILIELAKKYRVSETTVQRYYNEYRKHLAAETEFLENSPFNGNED
ncbi:MAG: hypothetical protein V7699_01635 [Porticoccus sp.]